MTRTADHSRRRREASATEALACPRKPAYPACRAAPEIFPPRPRDPLPPKARYLLLHLWVPHSRPASRPPRQARPNPVQRWRAFNTSTSCPNVKTRRPREKWMTAISDQTRSREPPTVARPRPVSMATTTAKTRCRRSRSRRRWLAGKRRDATRLPRSGPPVADPTSPKPAETTASAPSRTIQQHQRLVVW